MSEIGKIEGDTVIEMATSDDSKRPRVALCESSIEGKPFVVWYVDHNDRGSGGTYHETHEEARVAFEGRKSKN
jgi:hypothetical protein